MCKYLRKYLLYYDIYKYMYLCKLEGKFTYKIFIKIYVIFESDLYEVYDHCLVCLDAHPPCYPYLVIILKYQNDIGIAMCRHTATE